MTNKYLWKKTNIFHIQKSVSYTKMYFNYKKKLLKFQYKKKYFKYVHWVQNTKFKIQEFKYFQNKKYVWITLFIRVFKKKGISESILNSPEVWQ